MASEIGPEIEGYRIGDELGRGGMGVVHRAVSASGEPVAIKVLPSTRGSAAARARFAREAQALASLEHDCVVRTIEYGETALGAPYLVMELMQGESLADRLVRGRLPVDEALHVGGAVAAGLAAAHAAGIVHRDVKPANVFLCEDGRVKVFDFGLAGWMDESRATAITLDGAILGTPDYMSPEQARAESVDARSDVWGLAATLHHALGGQPPFRSPTIMGVLARITMGEPDPLPDDIPEWLRAVLSVALERRPDDRVSSMQELARALSDPRASAALSLRSSTALSDEVRVLSVLLAERVADRDAFEAAVVAQGGRATALLGGRGLGVFGGEQWRGDEAERAIHAGLAARSAAGRLGVALGRALRASAGTVTGEAVAEAERVLSEAGVGVDPRTLRRLSGALDVEGGAVVAIRSRAGGARRRAGTPLLGRGAELTQLRATCEAAFEEREAAGLLVVAPPGMGKTRLISELAAWLEEHHPGATCLWGQGDPRPAAHALAPLSSAVAAHLDLGTLGAAAARARVLDACPDTTTAALLGELLDVEFPETPELAGIRQNAVAMRDRLEAAFRDLVGAMATAPLLLVVEDLHWAGRALTDLLSRLLRELRDRPLVLVVTTRPEVDAPPVGFSTLSLRPLARRATREMLAAVLPDDDEALAEAIFARSGGNPFFIEELAYGHRDGVRELPLSIEAAVQARLDVLSRPEREVVRRASVLGRAFWVEALEALGAREPLELLAGLARREIVAPVARSRLPGSQQWQFRHALLQDVAYATLTEAQRRALHRSAGEWLASRPAAPAGETARHLELGGDSAGAARWWSAAARQARREGDLENVVAATEHALRAPAAAELELELRCMRFDAFVHGGRPDDEEAEVARMAAIATPAARVKACWYRSLTLRRTGRGAEALAEVRRGLRIDPDDVDLRHAEAAAQAAAGRFGEAVELARAALSRARQGSDERVLAEALSLTGYCLAAMGDAGRALPLQAEALGRFEAIGDRRRAAMCSVNMAAAHIGLGRPEETLRLLARTTARCREDGDLLQEGFCLLNSAHALTALSRTDEALARLDRCHELAQLTRDGRLLTSGAVARASALLGGGRPDEAIAVLDGPHAGDGPTALTIRASALVALGRAVEARAAAERALDARERGGGMSQFESTLFLAAHRAGIDGALRRGAALLLERAAALSDPADRRAFLEDVPTNAELLQLAHAES